MPSDEAYQAVLAELAKLGDAWRIHREVINRAIGLLNNEVLAFRDRLDKDDVDRIARQAQLDVTLKSIEDGQRLIRRWQWIRIGFEAITLAIILGIVFGRIFL
jgi:hypothetical protein